MTIMIVSEVDIQEASSYVYFKTASSSSSKDLISDVAQTTQTSSWCGDSESLHFQRRLTKPSVVSLIISF